MKQGDKPDAQRRNRSGMTALFPLLAETASNWMADNAMRLSAALSLYTLLSLAPLLVISLKVVSVVAGQRQAIEAIDEQLQSLMGPDAAGAAKTMIENGGKHGNGLVASVISTILLIISATGVFVELQDSMNTIWGVKPRPHQGLRNFVRNRLLSIGMVFGIGFLLLVSMIISTAIAGLARYIPGEVRQLTVVTDIVVSFFVVYVLFAGMLKVLPDVRLSWRNVSLAALLTAVLFTLGKYGLTLYFKFGTPISAFGAAGSLVAVLLWVYYSAFILFFGAEFAKVCSIRREGPVVPEPNAVAVPDSTAAALAQRPIDQ